jgi:hypothetical protein
VVQPWIIEMNVSVSHNRTLVDNRHGLKSGYWPISYPLGNEFALAVARTLATTVRDSIRRWSSQLLGTGIHLPPMSSEWLRMHETEHDKHRAEV